MTSSLLLKCQGILHNDNLENEHFIAIPSICNQRSLDYPRFTYVSHGSQNAPARIVPRQPKPGTICHPKPVGTNPGLTQ